MKLTKKIILSRPGMTMKKADALFGGKVSAWVTGEPVPAKHHSQVAAIFGVAIPAAKPVDVGPLKDEDVKKEEPRNKPKSKKKGK